MKKLILASSLIAAVSLSSGCAIAGKDMATNLRYANNKPVGIENIKFKDLMKMRRGDAYTKNFLYFFPIYGDGSIITAATNGGVNSVQLVGETEHWYGPFSSNCTVVFGDKDGVGVDDVIKGGANSLPNLPARTHY
jgi:hypothetical protein